MTGEAERAAHGWTVETSRVHNEAMRAGDKRLNKERDRRYEERLKAQALAVKTAADVVNVRLAGMNEWRDTVSDVLAKAMSSAEGEQRFSGVAKELATITARLERAEGKNVGLAAMWGYVLGAVGLIATLLAIIAVAFSFRSVGEQSAPQYIQVIPASPAIAAPGKK